MHKLACMFLASFLLIIPVAGYAEMPVFDAQTFAKSIEQIDKLKDQLKQMEKSHDAITGNRNFGTISDDKQYRDYLPQDWERTYDGISKNGLSKLTPEARRMYEEDQLWDVCSNSKESDEKVLCESAQAKPYQDKAYLQEALKKSRSRSRQIENLMGQINSTQDPKAISELQARIAIEQSLLANEQTKIELYKMASHKEDDIQYRRERQMIAKDAAKRGGMKLKPITFGNH